MAGVMNLIVYASFLLIVVNGQDNVSEQLREIKRILRRAMERHTAMLEDEQVETRRRMDVLDQQLNTLEDGQTETLRRMDVLDQQLEDGQTETIRRLDALMTGLEEVKELSRLDHLPRDCVDVQRRSETQSGVYIVQHNNKPLQVYCDLQTDGGGWLVFQRRQDGSVDFYRNWTQYESGFGDLSTEFWLGNKYLHNLTSGGNQQLRVDMEDFEGDKRYAEYDSFTVGSPADKYVLRIGAYQGTAGDSLTRAHNGHQFSTYDQNNDESSINNCARACHGAGWYGACYLTNPNGLYIHTGETRSRRAILWDDFRPFYPLKRFEMKLRPSNV